jgi:DNA-binding response OmpR family regulator
MGKLHVLVADDDPSLQLVIAETFRAAGYRVTTATDGEEALRLLAADRPDACVLDVGMPGRNGFELCRDLRSCEEWRNLPIVLLTARNADMDRHWGLDAGADEYLTKPFEPRALLAAVAGLIESRLSGEERNPITKLPALASVVRRARALAREGQPTATALVVLDPEATRVHRQKYGDMKNAEALRLAAACLRQALAAAALEKGAATPLCLALGHAGDVSYSRFVLAGPPAALEHALAKAAALFARQVPALYDQVDRERGHVLARDPTGTALRFPLLALVAETIPLAALENELRGAGDGAAAGDEGVASFPDQMPRAV